MRILLCDDHAVFADSLALVLADAGHTVVGVTYDPDDALAALRRRPADVCLIDLCFPAGTVLGRMAEFHAAAPATRFVILSGFLESQVVDAGAGAGVHGFAHKGQQAGDLVALLARIHAGERNPVRDRTRDVARGLVHDRGAGRPATTGRPRGQAQQAARFLTPREREVLTRLARGESTLTLAKAMGVTRSTARSHVQSVLTKLGVHSQREAVIEAARYGMVSVETGEWLLS
ncbi:response regulator transcription factor [Actinomadura sp. HBU206391]|uniref:response regulator transcription factor n=1 Tax=Actinomadura sp. HBU206391 TaxID=2731692 RepID=UPI00164F3EE8|nr:response regulator transcription factor [Actinomadura sp. HBU206391]MBC6462529.1 response regulator transcription factor [Actinomadura sp. HBU206391]